jgi:hypothetical protein
MSLDDSLRALAPDKWRAYREGELAVRAVARAQCFIKSEGKTR